jgi:hypothetical protein
MAKWKILRPFTMFYGHLVAIWYIPRPPFLVYRVEKNLSALPEIPKEI